MEKIESQNRLVAQIVRSKEILEGTYVKEEGWQPNYIISPSGKKISRVNLIGVAIEVSSGANNFSNLLIDDGSGVINIREFEPKGILDNINVGQIILVIGRPREYNSEKYILPEIVKPITNTKWVEVRKAQLARLGVLQQGVPTNQPVAPKIEKEKLVQTEEIIFATNDDNVLNTHDLVLRYIKDKDKGNGIDMENVVTNAKIDDCEEILKRLLEKGEIYEVSPGKVKVLD